MTGESLRQWQAEHYCPSSIVVALAGRFEERHVTALRERLAALPASIPRRMRDAVYRPAVTVRRKAIEQNHLILAYPGLSYRDDQRYALLLLNSILGGGCSSRLFQELREKRGLCYTVYSYVADHADTGLLGIYTATGGEQEAQALETVRNIVSDLAEHGPTQEELEQVLAFLRDTGLPLTLAQLGVKEIVPETLKKVAEAAVVPTQSTKNLRADITAQEVYDAILEADRIGRDYLAR